MVSKNLYTKRMLPIRFTFSRGRMKIICRVSIILHILLRVNALNWGFDCIRSLHKDVQGTALSDGEVDLCLKSLKHCAERFRCG